MRVLGRRTARDGRVWVRVVLAVLPNGTTAWVPRGALGGYEVVRTRLDVDTGALRATLYDRGRVVFRARVAVGTDSWPTPLGEFYVRNRLERYASPAYGPLAFGISARSATLTDWPAGGYVGIHGTDRPDLIPGRVSHGCIRLRNRDIRRLGRLMPVGNPGEDPLMQARRALVVAVVAVLVAPAAAAGQAPDHPTELWRQFPLNPTLTPVAQQRAAVPIAQTGGDGGSSSTAWLIAGVLGVAGIGLTIAGLASARREPEDEDLAAAAKRRDREADAAGRAQRRAARAEAESARRPRAGETGAAPDVARDGAAQDSGRTLDAPAAAPGGRAADEAGPAGRRRGRRKAPKEAVAAAPARPPAPTDDVDWEECRIALAVDGDDDHHFFAEHAGAGDPVARSPVFHARRTSAVMESAAARDALQGLVTTLLAGGWQVVGRDEDAWALRFRRRVHAGDRVERHPAGR